MAVKTKKYRQNIAKITLQNSNGNDDSNDTRTQNNQAKLSTILKKTAKAILLPLKFVEKSNHNQNIGQSI